MDEPTAERDPLAALNDPALIIGPRGRDRAARIAQRRGLIEQSEDDVEDDGVSTVVYICRDRRTATVFYVGITDHFRQRRASHRAKSWWTDDVVMTIESRHPSREDAEERERDLIYELAPLYNLMHSNPVRTIERAREQWLAVDYDPRAVNLVLKIAQAETPDDFEQCQRLALRCLYNLLPAEAKRRSAAESRQERRERRRVRLAESSAEPWATLDEFAALGPAYPKYGMQAAARRGELDATKFEGVWHTTHDRISAWVAGLSYQQWLDAAGGSSAHGE